MANQETQILDDIIVKSRRKMLTLGAASLASMAVGAFAPKAASAATTYTDADILNFALNLEYLEANFYYQAAFGTTIDVANAASTAAGAPLIVLNQTVGTKGVVTGGSKVPFKLVTVGAYATETAVEEGKHVKFLQGALGTAAVAQPAINIGVGAGNAWGTLATAALGPASSAFTPYDSDADFLVGAYVFEDVGVTAYHGAASLLTVSGNLSAAAGILAVEAYHAGLVRTTINALDPTNASGYLAITAKISALRATLAKQALLGIAPSATSYDNTNDDYGLANTSGVLPTVSLAGGTAVSATNIVDVDLTLADPINSICFARTVPQILNIVTGGGAVNATATAAVSPATGVFFPAGLNGLFK
jgi:Ferritin-like domain